MVSSRWAILLCKFNDDDGEPFDRKFYDEFFTGSGIGKQNIVDYFRDVSHGMLDQAKVECLAGLILESRLVIIGNTLHQ